MRTEELAELLTNSLPLHEVLSRRSEGLASRTLLKSSTIANAAMPTMSSVAYLVHGYILLGDDETQEELKRDIYASLLASLIDGSRMFHPSFASLAPQLSDQDITVLKELSNNHHSPLIEVREDGDTEDGFQVMGRVYEVTSSSISAAEQEFTIDHLQRLGLIGQDMSTHLTEADRYRELAVQARLKLIRNHARHYTLKRGIVTRSQLGRAFIEAAFR